MPARGTATNRQRAVNRGLASNRQRATNRQNVDGSGGGGGGADLTNVSSLPAPGAADSTTIYHLSTDDRCYILNNAGTALVPIDLPGWPRRDGAADEEWEGSNTDPPSGWTWDNQNGTTVNTNNTRKSFITLSRSADAASQTVLYKNVPASPNKTYYAAIQWASDLNGSGNNTQCGLALRATATGALLIYTMAANPTPTLFVSNWSTSTLFNSIAYTETVIPVVGPGSYYVLAFTSDGTNIAFKYSPFHEGGEGNYVTVFTVAIATFLGAFNSYGLSFFKNSGTTSTMFCDWIRVV